MTDAREAIDRIDALFPLMPRLGERWAASRPFEGLRLVWSAHLTTLTACVARALLRGGGRWALTACNPATTDPAVVALLKALGIEVIQGADGAARRARALSPAPAALIDTGFDLCGALAAGPPPAGFRGAVEITASGVARLRALGASFPVVNVDGGELKPAIENRHGVGEGTWQALSAVTGHHPGGRRAVVVGYGAVGMGVAAYGRALGAAVEVVEIDPIRRLKARFDGFPTPALEGCLPGAGIVITATGASRVITAAALSAGGGPVVVGNVGHWGDEIDVAGLRAAGPGVAVGPHLRRFDAGGRPVYLVCGGEPLNIVLNAGSPEPTLLHLALGGLALEHLLGARLPPGEVRVPREVEALAASLALAAHG